MKLLRRIAALVIGLSLVGLAQAQGYPNKPVRIIVPYQVGQGTDVATRLIAEHLSKALGQSFFIDNKPGAGGNIGTEAAARSSPDGYTLVMGTNATHGTNQFLYQTMPFDAEKDFEPIILIGSFPMVIAANPSFPGNSVSDIVATAKSQPTSSADSCR
jgi:tripartite-type tricarboxylate transporter receptor subunit TctC